MNSLTEYIKITGIAVICYLLYSNTMQQQEIKQLLKIEAAKTIIKIENEKQETIKNDIKKTIDFVRDANRTQRDSLRAIYNPR